MLFSTTYSTSNDPTSQMLCCDKVGPDLESLHNKRVLDDAKGLIMDKMKLTGQSFTCGYLTVAKGTRSHPVDRVDCTKSLCGKQYYNNHSNIIKHIAAEHFTVPCSAVSHFNGIYFLTLI